MISTTKKVVEVISLLSGFDKYQGSTSFPLIFIILWGRIVKCKKNSMLDYSFLIALYRLTISPSFLEFKNTVWSAVFIISTGDTSLKM